MASQNTNVMCRDMERELHQSGFRLLRTRGSHETWEAPDGAERVVFFNHQKGEAGPKNVFNIKKAIRRYSDRIEAVSRMNDTPRVSAPLIDGHFDMLVTEERKFRGEHSGRWVFTHTHKSAWVLNQTANDAVDVMLQRVDKKNFSRTSILARYWKGDGTVSIYLLGLMADAVAIQSTWDEIYTGPMAMIPDSVDIGDDFRLELDKTRGTLLYPTPSGVRSEASVVFYWRLRHKSNRLHKRFGSLWDGIGTAKDAKEEAVEAVLAYLEEQEKEMANQQIKGVRRAAEVLGVSRNTAERTFATLRVEAPELLPEKPSNAFIWASPQALRAWWKSVSDYHTSSSNAVMSRATRDDRPETFHVGKITVRAMRPPREGSVEWYWRAEYYNQGKAMKVYTGWTAEADLRRLVSEAIVAEGLEEIAGDNFIVLTNAEAPEAPKAVDIKEEEEEKEEKELHIYKIESEAVDKEDADDKTLDLLEILDALRPKIESIHGLLDTPSARIFNRGPINLDDVLAMVVERGVAALEAELEAAAA